MKLLPEEATYLRERILSSCSGTLLAHLADLGAPWDSVEFAWEHDGFDELPKALQHPLRHAQTFSEVMHGAAILYNVMLAQAAGSDRWLMENEAAFEEWAGAERLRQDRLKNWDLAEFWGVAAAQGARISLSSRTFVGAWVSLLRMGTNPRDLARDPAARRLIEEREATLKKGRARLKSRRHLELWSGASGMGQLDFRWGISQRLLLDILAALPKSRRRRERRA